MGRESLEFFQPPLELFESVDDRARQGEAQFVWLRRGQPCRGLDLKLRL
jgi:hypothetical protein